jgi:hypothetical protein
MKSRCLSLSMVAAAVASLAFVLGNITGVDTARAQDSKTEQPPTHYLYNGQVLSQPRSQREIDWLMQRKREQEEDARHYDVVHDFRFTDSLAASGITFKNSVTEDSKSMYKAVHYDHGNGIAVADVDGDGLDDIYFVTQMGCNQLWRNLGGGRFENITEKAGVGMCDQISVTASFADVDNDGRPDLFVTTVRHGNHLFHNDGGGKFTDITEQSGLSYSGHSSGATFFDYNRDGLLDLLVSNVGRYTGDQKGPGGYYLGYPDAFSGHLHPNRTEPCILYKNLGNNRFQDVTKASGITTCGWNGDATFVDLHNNGFPSLYLTNMQGNDHFYENVDGDHFVDKTDEYFPKTPWGAMCGRFFDFNNDGLMDLYITDMHSDMSHDLSYDAYKDEKKKSTMAWPDTFLVGHEKSIFGNAFYKNLGNGKFAEMSDEVGLENYWPWGFSVGDFNADGFDDIFVTTGMSYYFRYVPNKLMLNDFGKKFLDAEFVVGVEPRRDNQTVMPWFNIDCGGMDFIRTECTGSMQKFTVLGSLSTRSSAVFDLDGDGDLDIVTNEFNNVPQVLISNLAQNHKIAYLKVQLVGTKSNREGLGTRVVVAAGGLKLTKYMDGKSGYLSQSDLPLYFGLGSARKIDSVEVLWPSGTHQTVAHANINGTLEVVEDGHTSEVPDKR